MLFNPDNSELLDFASNAFLQFIALTISRQSSEDKISRYIITKLHNIFFLDINTLILHTNDKTYNSNETVTMTIFGYPSKPMILLNK